MAQKVTVELVDDLDGTPIPDGEGSTVTFAFQRKTYEIDLSSENIEKLEAALAPFVSVARVADASPKESRPARTPRTARRQDLVAVRAWAHVNGHDVSERGRLPASVLAAYDAGH
ncbi:Lsr2 family protein [Microbacterium sp. B2969]|uniref:Lsr2 family protein n=1 Tax=Microbacterium alkaliflavum TaxID=3248839 RepID=A0ABW7QC13_9MICO